MAVEQNNTVDSLNRQLEWARTPDGDKIKKFGIAREKLIAALKTVSFSEPRFQVMTTESLDGGRSQILEILMFGNNDDGKEYSVNSQDYKGTEPQVVLSINWHIDVIEDPESYLNIEYLVNDVVEGLRERCGYEGPHPFEVKQNKKEIITTDLSKFDL